MHTRQKGALLRITVSKKGFGKSLAFSASTVYLQGFVRDSVLPRSSVVTLYYAVHKQSIPPRQPSRRLRQTRQDNKRQKKRRARNTKTPSCRNLSTFLSFSQPFLRLPSKHLRYANSSPLHRCPSLLLYRSTSTLIIVLHVLVQAANLTTNRYPLSNQIKPAPVRGVTI